MNGTLYKYTNFAKGWQRRYFVLDGTTLNYYLREPFESEPVARKARGSLPIVGAMITPSDEDGHGFTVSASNGDVYKLKASDARNRQMWVDHLRSSAGGALLPHPTDSSCLNPNSTYFSDVTTESASNSKLYDQLVNAKDRVTASRKYLAEIEDKCEQMQMNDLYLQLMSYGHSAIVSLERAIDIADRTYLFSKGELSKSLLPESDLSHRSVSLEKASSESEGEEEIELVWTKVDWETLPPINEYSDDQRANMISIMQQIPYGGNLLSQIWPDWLNSNVSGSQIVAQLCRFAPHTGESIDFLKWILSGGL